MNRLLLMVDNMETLMTCSSWSQGLFHLLLSVLLCVCAMLLELDNRIIFLVSIKLVDDGGILVVIIVDKLDAMLHIRYHHAMHCRKSWRKILLCGRMCLCKIFYPTRLESCWMIFYPSLM